jgi:hypothetical protein
MAKIVWLVKDPEKGLYADEFKVSLLLSHKIIYKKGRIFKKEYIVYSDYDIESYLVDSESMNLLLMQQEEDRLVPIPLQIKDKDMVSLIYEIAKQQKQLYIKDISILREIVSQFINGEMERSDNWLKWYSELFNSTGRIVDKACIAINLTVNFIETHLGEKISHIDMDTFKNNVIDSLREELKSLKSPDDLLKKPLLSSFYNPPSSSKTINREEQAIPYTISNPSKEYDQEEPAPKKSKKNKENKKMNDESNVSSKVSRNDMPENDSETADESEVKKEARSAQRKNKIDWEQFAKDLTDGKIQFGNNANKDANANSGSPTSNDDKNDSALDLF